MCLLCIFAFFAIAGAQALSEPPIGVYRGDGRISLLDALTEIRENPALSRSEALKLLARVASFPQMEGMTVYVSGGAGTAGSSEQPFDSFMAAVKALNGGGGRIVLCGDIYLPGGSVIPEQSANLTITAEGGRLILGGDLIFAQNENDNLITLDTPVTVSNKNGAALFGGFNSLHFTRNFEVSGKLHFYGGADSAKGSATGTDARAEYMVKNRTAVTELPYTITVDGGKFETFCGGNRRKGYDAILGAIAAPITIVVRGGTFGGGVSYAARDVNKMENAFSISGMSILASDAELLISGGTFNLPIYAQGRIGEMHAYSGACSPLTASDRKYYAIDGDISIRIDGGTLNGCEISAYQDSPSYAQVLRGDFDVTVNSGAVLAENMYVDATQVKAYAGSEKRASLNYSGARSLNIRRFDFVNGAARHYEEPLRIACIGDSITQGSGSSVPLTDSYPSVLLSMTAAEGMDVVVGNYGIGGSSVLSYTQRWYNDTLPYMITTEEADADFIILGLGTNDANTTGRSSGQARHFYELYKTLVQTYGELPKTNTVFTTSAIYRRTSSALSDLCAVTNVRALQQRVTEELQKEAPGKYVYIDLYALTLEAALEGKLLSRDWLHPSTAGYKIYTEKIYDAVFEGVTEVKNFAMDDVYISTAGRPNGAGTASDPISELPVAFARAKPQTTIHVMGTFTFGSWVITPLNVDRLNIVGEGSGATLATTSNAMRFQSDVRIDNLTLKSTGSGALYIALNFNNAELTERVSTGKSVLTAGHLVYRGDIAQTAYDFEEAVSSDRDITVEINGGTYAALIGGNLRLNNDSPLGVYSGNMKLHIGRNVTVADHAWNGINGMNYLTGRILADIDAWGEGMQLRDFAILRTLSGIVFDEDRNTGTVTLDVAENVKADLKIANNRTVVK